MNPKITWYIRTAVGVCYILIAVCILLMRSVFVDDYPSWSPWAMAAILIGYGLFRIYRSYEIYQENEESE
ncbi:MAG: hypothetical protein RLZZ292_3251 [Bacteroidota bacterium]|jgi:hypothetical protein